MKTYAAFAKKGSQDYCIESGRCVPNAIFYLGLYGGISTDGIWMQDAYEPKRYFAMYPDEEIQQIIECHFQIEDFHTRDMGGGNHSFKSDAAQKLLGLIGVKSRHMRKPKQYFYDQRGE